MHDNVVIFSIMTLTEGKIVQHDQLIKWTQFFGDFSNPEDWLGVSPHPAGLMAANPMQEISVSEADFHILCWIRVRWSSASFDYDALSEVILFLRLKSSNQCNFTVEKLATNAVPQSNVDDHSVISCTFRAKMSPYNCPPLLVMQFKRMQGCQCGWCIVFSCITFSIAGLLVF